MCDSGSGGREGGLSPHSAALPCRGCILGTTRGGLQRATHDTKPTRNSKNVFPVVSGYRAHTQSADHRPVCTAASTVAYCTFVVCTESVLLALPLSSHAGPFKSTHSWPLGQDSNLNADSKYTSCSWAPAAGIQSIQLHFHWAAITLCRARAPFSTQIVRWPVTVWAIQPRCTSVCFDQSRGLDVDFLCLWRRTLKRTRATERVFVCNWYGRDSRPCTKFFHFLFNRSTHAAPLTWRENISCQLNFH